MSEPLVMGIFVGGRGRRMGGVQKALLIAPDTGETLVARLLRLGRAAGHEVVLLGAAELGAEAPGVPQLPDAAANIGPLAGLQSLLAHAGQREALCLACDMPFISAELLARLAANAPRPSVPLAEATRPSDARAEAMRLGEARAEATRPSVPLADATRHSDARADERGRSVPPAADVWAPRDLVTGKWEPLFARYCSAAVAPVLARALAEGERSFQGLFARLTVQELLLDATERAQLRDWDTPEDMHERR